MTMKPEKLALLARHKRMRDRQPELTKALRCYPDDHFRPLLSELLEEQDRLTAKMRLLEERIQERMEPHQELVERLCEIPGIERLAAWMVISEIGVDMSRFPTAGHLASCCGLCPGNAESAGKRHSAPAKANAMCAGAGAGSLGGGSHQPEADVFHYAVLSDQQPRRNEESGRRLGAPASLRHLLDDPHWFELSRAGGRSL